MGFITICLSYSSENPLQEELRWLSIVSAHVWGQFSSERAKIRGDNLTLFPPGFIPLYTIEGIKSIPS